MCSNYRHHTTFKSGHNWEDVCLCDASKRVKFFSLTSSKVCISTRILKREMTSFLIHNSQPKDTVCDWIHRPKLSVDLEVTAVRFFLFVLLSIQEQFVQFTKSKSPTKQVQFQQVLNFSLKISLWWNFAETYKITPCNQEEVGHFSRQRNANRKV